MDTTADNTAAPADFDAVADEVRALFRKWYPVAGWWMRKDFDPTTPGECLVGLNAIRDSCYRSTWTRCMEKRRWLSHHTSAQSSAS